MQDELFEMFGFSLGIFDLFIPEHINQLALLAGPVTISPTWKMIQTLKIKIKYYPC